MDRAGLVDRAPRAYLAGMSFLTRLSPVRAIRDLRVFLGQREPYEMWFLLAAMGITGFLVFAFVHDSTMPRAYKPNIIYVEQWPLDRTDAQIKAQQVIDQRIRDKQDAEQAAREEKLRLQFKAVDDKLKKYGI